MDNYSNFLHRGVETGKDYSDYFDYANRLKKVEKNDTTIGEYIYDGDDKRIQAIENNETTTYIYTGWSVLYEKNSTGTACHIYGPAGLLAKRTTVNQESNTYFYHTDHLGSTRLVTDDKKNIVTAVTYHPFGEIDVKEGSEDFLFTSKEMDSTGLYYYGTRYYDPEIGRFLTRDTWTYLPNDARSSIDKWLYNPQHMNRYAYCLNNPLKYIDPIGHGELGAFLATIGFVAALLVLLIFGGPLAWFFFALAAISYFVAIGEYSKEIEERDDIQIVTLKDKNGGIAGRIWLKNEELFAGYYWDGENDCWMVYSTEAGDFVPVSPDEWSPPDTEEPVTLEKFPPKDPDGDPPKDPPAGSGTSTGNSGNIPPVGPVARGNSIM